MKCVNKIVKIGENNPQFDVFSREKHKNIKKGKEKQRKSGNEHILDRVFVKNREK